MPQPAPASLTDAELTGLLRTRTTAPSAANELMRRHSSAALGAAYRLGADPDRAQEWAVAAFNLVLGAVQAGSGPVGAWGPYLEDAVRQVAAATGTSSTPATVPRSPGPPPNTPPAPGPPAGPGTRPPALVIAFRRLPPARQAELQRELAAGSGPATVSGCPSPSGGYSESPARAGLHTSYLQVHTSLLSARTCRHLTARLDDLVRDGAAVPSDIGRHLRQCPHCSRAYEDLRVLHGRHGDALVRLLAGRQRGELPGGPGPVAGPDTGPGPVESPLPGRTGSGHRSGAATFRKRAVATATGVGFTALCAGLTFLPGRPAEHAEERLLLPASSNVVRDTAQLGLPVSHPSPSASPVSPAPPLSASPEHAVPSGIGPRRSPKDAATAESSGSGTPAPPTGAPSPTPVATPSTDRDLRLGDDGADVRRLQELLAAANCKRFSPAFVSGLFDLGTQVVLSDFQRAARIRGRESGGVYGPRTRAALERAAISPNC